MDRQSLEFRANRGGSLPAPQLVKARFVGYAVLVGYPAGTEEPSWLDIAHASSDEDGATFRFSITTTSPPQDLYAVPVVFVTAQEDGDDIKTESINVTYSLTSQDNSPRFSISPSKLEFTAFNFQGTLPAAQSLQVTTQPDTELEYVISVSYGAAAQSWLTVPQRATSPQSISLQPNTTALAPGTYTAQLTFSAGSLPPERLVVTYTVMPTGLVVAPTQLGFDVYQGQALPAAKDVQITVSNGSAEFYTASVTYAAGAQGWLSVPAPGSAPGTVSIRPSSTALPPGTYTATVRLQPTGGSLAAAQLTVSYRVQAALFTASPSQLDFTATQGQSALPTARTVQADGRGSQLSYTVTTRYSGSARDWLTLPASGTTPQTDSIRPNTTALPPGQYSAVVTFTPTDGQAAAEVTVTYTVSAATLVATPGQPVLRVDSATTEAALTSQLGLSSTGGPLDWRVASFNASWLDNTPVSGNTQSQPHMSLVLVKSQLAQLANGDYSGSVTLAYGPAGVLDRQLVVPVKLTVALPVVRTVMPYVAEAGRSLSHVLRGEGFSTLPSGQPLRFGSTQASTYQVLSDTEIRLDVPALPVGVHAVQVDNALGLSRPGAELHAVQTPALTELTLARSYGPRRLIYDPLRLAVYTVDYDSGVPRGLYRYQYVNGTWQHGLYVSLPKIWDAVMDVDGQSLYLSIDTGLYRLDLDDATATPQFIRTIGNNHQLTVLNDGRVLNVDSCWSLPTALDGRRVVRVDVGCTSPPRNILTFDASDTDWRSTSISTYNFRTRTAVDRTARYAVVGETVYNSQFGLVSGFNYFAYSPLFTPDARRLYVFDDDTNQNRQVLYVYDVSGPPVGGQFPQLSRLVMPGALASDSIHSTRGVVTPDGRTLIKADSTQLYIFPIPPALQ